MAHPNFILFYVNLRLRVDFIATFSCDLYRKLKYLFALITVCYCWKRSGVRPPQRNAIIAVDGIEEVSNEIVQWRAHVVSIIQAPCDMDFGHTFVAVDPDGHRIL